MQIGNVPALGPGCNQFQDSGLSAAALATLQGQITALQNIVNNINAPVLLNTLTASNSATLSDTTSLTSTYNYYQIEFENLLPATNSVTLELQVHSGGTFQTTTYVSTVVRGNGAGVGAQSSTTFVDLTVQTGVANTGPGMSGRILVYNPSGASTPKIFTGVLSTFSTNSSAEVAMISGWWNGGNGAVDGFQVLASTGNLTSGVIRIYGVK